MSTRKRIGLLNCCIAVVVAVSIALLALGTLSSIVPCLLALETGNVTQILLSRSVTVLVVVPIPIVTLEVAMVGTVVSFPP